MNAVKPTPFTTPDGVERELRNTHGAKKRIMQLFGMPWREALNKYDSGAFPEILFALMHDVNGQPPEGITVLYLAENMSDTDSPEVMGAIMEALTNGAIEKKAYATAMRKVLKEQLEKMLIGSNSGASALSASDSLTSSSGGDTSSAKSMHESNGIPNNSEEMITVSES